MLGKNILDIVAVIIALGAALAINKSGVKKHTIEDLQALVEVHEKTIKVLKAESALKDERIKALEETINGYSELVREGYLAGGNGQGSGHGPAHSKIAKNRGV